MKGRKGETRLTPGPGVYFETVMRGQRKTKRRRK